MGLLYFNTSDEVIQ